MGSTDLAKVFDPPTLVIILMFIASVGSLVSGKFVVPRFVYDREKDRAEKSERQIEKLTDVLEDYNAQLRSLRRGQTDE
jgi:p-aminobenzoyl-glutamate transporter AbgT